MTLLDTFTLAFGTEGLSEIAEDIKKTEDQINSLEKEEEELNKVIKKGGKEAEEAKKKIGEVNKTLKDSKKHLDEVKKSTGGTLIQLKNVAAIAAKIGGVFFAFKKAADYTTNFVDNVLEVADAADKAGESLEEYQKKTFGRTIFSKQDVVNAKEYEMTMRDIRAGTAQIGANLAQLLLPAMTKIAKVTSKVIDFLAEHGTFIKAVFIGLGVAITAMALPAVINLGIALWTALAPIIVPVAAVTAAIIALALTIEDLWKWMHGEPSLAELMLGPFKEIQAAFEQGFINGIKKIFSVWLNSFTNFYNEIWSKMPKWLQVLLSLGNPAGLAMTIKSFTDSKKADGSHASGLDYVPFDGYVAELHKGERVQTASEAQDWRSSLSAAKNAVNFTANYPLNSIPSGAISNAYNNSNPTNNINIGDITINTQATDAQGISFDLAKHIKQAMISLDDGMLA